MVQTSLTIELQFAQTWLTFTEWNFKSSRGPEAMMSIHQCEYLHIFFTWTHQCHNHRSHLLYTMKKLVMFVYAPGLRPGAVQEDHRVRRVTCSWSRYVRDVYSCRPRKQQQCVGVGSRRLQQRVPEEMEESWHEEDILIPLTHIPLVLHICVSELGKHCFR